MYKRLPQKSKDRLEEALIGWAAWHAAAYGDDPDDSEDSLIVNITPVRRLSIKTEGRAGCAIAWTHFDTFMPDVQVMTC